MSLSVNFSRKRAAAVIIQNGKILLMHRKRGNREYFVFPGGGIEEGETPFQAAIRELQEEFSIDIKIDKIVFELLTKDHKGRESYGYYFLVTHFTGTPELGGEEKDQMSDSNYYAPIWIDLGEIATMENLVPNDARDALVAYLEKQTVAV